MRLLPVGFRSAEAKKRIVLCSAYFPGHSGPGSDPESGQRAGLQLAPGSPDVYNSPPEAPKVNKSRPGGLQDAPRRPRRSTNSPREVYNSPPEAPKVNKSRPGGLHIPPPKAPEVYKSRPSGATTQPQPPSPLPGATGLGMALAELAKRKQFVEKLQVTPELPRHCNEPMNQES